MIIPGDKVNPLTGQEKPILRDVNFLKVKDVGEYAAKVA